MSAVDPPRRGERLLLAGVAALLLLSPWHELIVRLWKPLGAWDEAVLAALLGALAWRGRGAWRPCRFLAPALALAAAALVSALAHGGPAWPLRAWVPFLVAGVAAAQLPRSRVRPLLSALLVTAALAMLCGVVTFLVFRAIGGGLNLRPDLPPHLPGALVYPYYCGAVPRSGHLVGPFMNDLYFGLWVAGVLGLLAGWRPVAPGWGAWSHAGLAALGLASLAWTYSRSAYLALAAVALFLALRVSPRVLIGLALAGLVALPLLRGPDLARFRAVADPAAAFPGRWDVMRRAAATLAGGPFLGLGPGAVRLADTQFAKVVVETGWPGAVALGWLLVAWLGPALSHLAGPPDEEGRRLHVGLSAFVLALLVGGLSGEILEVPQVALPLWILAGLRETLEGPPGEGAPAARREPPGS